MTTKNNTLEDEGSEDLIPRDKIPQSEAEFREAEKNPPETTEEPESEKTTEEEEDTKEEVEDSEEDNVTTTGDKPEVGRKEPAPVEGETPREKALRKELQRLRETVRKNNVKETFATNEEPSEESKNAYNDLKAKGYSDQQIADMELAIDVIASKKGYVKTDPIQSVQVIVDSFIEEYPEYKPSNDKDDVRWNKFSEILNGGTYNLKGKTADQLRKIFSKVNDDVIEELGPAKVSNNQNQKSAQIHKLQVSSAGAGGNKSTVPKSDKKVRIDYKQPVSGIKLIGFDDDDFTED